MNPHDHNDQRILSPVCLPIPPLGHVYNIAPSRATVNQKVVKKMLTLAASPNKQNSGDTHQNIGLYKELRTPTHLRLMPHLEYQLQSRKRDNLFPASDPNRIHNIQRDRKYILLSHRFDKDDAILCPHIKYVSCDLLFKLCFTYHFKFIVNQMKNHPAILFRK